MEPTYRGLPLQPRYFTKAPLKMPLLRLGRIYCPNSALRKSRNTQSIPEFPQLDLEQYLLPKPSKKHFQRMPIGGMNLQ